jgi:hypothetical protein
MKCPLFVRGVMNYDYSKEVEGLKNRFGWPKSFVLAFFLGKHHRKLSSNVVILLFRVRIFWLSSDLLIKGSSEERN